MATTTASARSYRTNQSWRLGVAAGVLGAAAMAALMLGTGARSVLAGAIPGLYGLAPPPTPAAGLAVHLSHGAVLGVGFAALVGVAGLDTPRGVVAGGLAYGVLAWVLLAVLVMPLWLGTVGFPSPPPFPNVAPPSLLWHAVYGTVAGAVYTATNSSIA
jgi:hypothetical protein